ncbi:MAG TPA: nuclear transport factor 2 family protein [Gemmatimonadaceae bacterium]
MCAAYVDRSALTILAALALACSTSDGGRGSNGRATIQAGVDSVADRLLAALRADAPDSLLALMADDVVIMPPNEPVLNGKAAVRSWYEQFVKQMRTSSLTITNREVLIGGDYATEVARFEWRLLPVAGGPPMVDRGSYMQVWHRGSDARWAFSREVWNSTTPLSR